MNPQTYWTDVADWFRQKGFKVGDVVTERGFEIYFPLPQKPCKKKDSGNLQFILACLCYSAIQIYRKVRGRKHLGVIHFEGGLYGAMANKYTNWVFVVYRPGSIDLVNKLAYELWANFGVNIQVVYWWTRQNLTEFRALTDEEWVNAHWG